MTNLLQVIQFTLLVTNTTTEYEKEWIPVPCPDGKIGCAVYHADSRPKADPAYRYVITTIEKIARTIVPALNLTSDVKNIHSKTIQRENREIVWKPAGPPEKYTTFKSIIGRLPSFTNNWFTNIIADNVIFHK